MKRVLWLLAFAVLGLVAYLSFWPVPIQAVSWKAPAAPGYTGPHKANEGLAQLNLIPLGIEAGPEHIVLARDGKLYAAVASGRVRRMNPDVCGTRYIGREAVGAGFAEVWATFPDAHWGNARHFVSGDRGVSEWTFTGTRADGTRVEVHGCDLFTFRDGKIALKTSYRKSRPPQSRV